MKQFTLFAIALGTLSICAVTALSGSGSVLAADPEPGKPLPTRSTASTPAPPNGAAKGLPGTDDLSAGEDRGRLRDQISVCSGAPPCSEGCRETTSHKACEKSQH